MQLMHKKQWTKRIKCIKYNSICHFLTTSESKLIFLMPICSVNDFVNNWSTILSIHSYFLTLIINSKHSAVTWTMSSYLQDTNITQTQLFDYLRLLTSSLEEERLKLKF